MLLTQGWLNWQHNFKRKMMMLPTMEVKAAHMIYTSHHMIQDILVNKAPVITIISAIQDHNLTITMMHHMMTSITAHMIKVLVLTLTDMMIDIPISTDLDHDHVVMTRNINTNININISTQRVDELYNRYNFYLLIL